MHIKLGTKASQESETTEKRKMEILQWRFQWMTRRRGEPIRPDKRKQTSS